MENSTRTTRKYLQINPVEYKINTQYFLACEQIMYKYFDTIADSEMKKHSA